MLLTISVQFSMSSGLHELWCSDAFGAVPAGPRLFHGVPEAWPDDIRFAHESEEDAERDAVRLRKYLEAVAAKKTKKR